MPAKEHVVLAPGELRAEDKVHDVLVGELDSHQVGDVLLPEMQGCQMFHK